MARNKRPFAMNEIPEAQAELEIRHAHKVHGEEGYQEYLRRLVDSLFVLEPFLCEHFTRIGMGELCEEVARREDPKHAHAVITLLKEIENDWFLQS